MLRSILFCCLAFFGSSLSAEEKISDKKVEMEDSFKTELIRELNKAYADEWLAYYQYWLGARVVKGPMREKIVWELDQHAGDELRHAEMIIERVLELGGEPIYLPLKWHDISNCAFTPPREYSEKKVVEQNIDGEDCAIVVYTKLLEMTKDKDAVTYKMISEILQDEQEHITDLKKLLEMLK